ncbi:MAG: hypothetical protein M1833_000505 [Piccolia ochrophora]|nr:MAG: hypothetical protein M1833_000505 [Piccolia ochrophora]
MTATRPLIGALLRLSRPELLHQRVSPFPHVPPLAARRRPAPGPARLQGVRWHSAPPSNSKVYNFEDVKAVVDSPSEERILIDVREPAEYQAGFIPSAINIPISSQPDALFLPEEEFEDRFGFGKPSPSHEVVFYCKAGVRSSAAAIMAQQGGYEKVGEYRGSWLDWQKNGGQSSK